MEWLDRPKQKTPYKRGSCWLRGLDLNQRPLGYEPNELPGCSTPRLFGALNAFVLKILMMVPRPGIEPGRALGPRDFKSLASASSAISANYPDHHFRLRNVRLAREGLRPKPLQEGSKGRLGYRPLGAKSIRIQIAAGKAFRALAFAQRPGFFENL